MQTVHYTPEAAAAVIVGVALAVTRLLTASRPFWTLSWLHRWGTLIGPALLVALGALPVALANAKTWTDIAVAIVMCAGIAFAGAHGKKSPPSSGDVAPVAASPVARRDVPPSPDDEPPAAAMRLCLPPGIYGISRTLVLGGALLIGACGGSAWQAQQGALNGVVQASNVVQPVLEESYARALERAAEQAPDQTAGAVAQQLVTAKWAPVWQAYEAYADAIAAWQTAIDTEGDVLSTAAAAHVAYCKLRAAAMKLQHELPDFPAASCP